ncbi:extensin family protein [Sphingomonas sp. ID0503]|uniref:extensin-like domain-containing protein n=1 Tax=Sphingomonas sp. ID0503 TaxID=3399691 RepID=UPI003AFAADEC
MAVRLVLRLIAVLLVLAGIGAGLLILSSERPQDVPWTKLDLGTPVGVFTGRKIVALGREGPSCHAALDRAGVTYNALPPRTSGQCGYQDAVRFERDGARNIRFDPTDLGVSCPVAAGLSAWEWNVVQPAALKIYGQQVARIDHFGSYSCRRMYGRGEGAWSEHATANAIDVAGFRLEDGRRVTVVNGWNGEDAKGRAFLRQVRDGACDLFATVLSPEYNAAHRDHLHLDQAARGAAGWRACR